MNAKPDLVVEYLERAPEGCSWFTVRLLSLLPRPECVDEAAPVPDCAAAALVRQADGHVLEVWRNGASVGLPVWIKTDQHIAEAQRVVNADRKPTVPDVMPLVRAYYETHLTGGHLHIVLDDGNVADHHIHFCRAEAEKAGDPEGVALADALLLMSERQRLKIYREI